MLLRSLAASIALALACGANPGLVGAAPSAMPAHAYASNAALLDGIETRSRTTLDASASGEWGAARAAVRRIGLDVAAIHSNRERLPRTQSLDASAKWLTSAVDRKNASEVKKAAASLTLAIHELRERVSQR